MRAETSVVHDPRQRAVNRLANLDEEIQMANLKLAEGNSFVRDYRLQRRMSTLVWLVSDNSSPRWFHTVGNALAWLGLN